MWLHRCSCWVEDSGADKKCDRLLSYLLYVVCTNALLVMISFNERIYFASIASCPNVILGKCKTWRLAPCSLLVALVNNIATQHAWWWFLAQLQLIRKSLLKTKNDAKKVKLWEPVNNKNRFSIPIPSQSRNREGTMLLCSRIPQSRYMGVNFSTVQ